MARILVLSTSPAGSPALSALTLLGHTVHVSPPTAAGAAASPASDLVMVDARDDLIAARALCGIMRAAAADRPLIVVVTEGGLAALSAEWGIDDVIVAAAGVAEVDARVRLALGQSRSAAASTRVQTSGITIDESSYSARVNNRPIDLTYKEFQLLHFLATHPAHVFTREQLLSEVWGYDYFGGTRTVDVHVRRLRAKLGDHEQVIATVRNVGYRFNTPDDES